MDDFILVAQSSNMPSFLNDPCCKKCNYVFSYERADDKKEVVQSYSNCRYMCRGIRFDSVCNFCGDDAPGPHSLGAQFVDSKGICIRPAPRALEVDPSFIKKSDDVEDASREGGDCGPIRSTKSSWCNVQ